MNTIPNIKKWLYTKNNAPKLVEFNSGCAMNNKCNNYTSPKILLQAIPRELQDKRHP